MKKILLTTLVSLFFMRCGTDQGSSKTYVYTVKNTSGYNLKIYAYLNEIVSPTITLINNGEELTKKYEDFNPPSGYDFSRFFDPLRTAMGRDSIMIIYNNEKKQNFKSKCDTDRNPLNFCEYSGLRETFIFTNEDYENAEDCGGPCE